MRLWLVALSWMMFFPLACNAAHDLGSSPTLPGKYKKQNESDAAEPEEVETVVSNGTESPEPSFSPTPVEESRPLTEKDVFLNMPDGEEQMKVICSRSGQDAVRKVFCGANPPAIRSLADLQKAFGLTFSPTANSRNQNGTGGNAGFALTGHSSSLVSRFTSSINPRAIIFTPPVDNKTPDPNFVALGFVRGEQFAEIIANDPATKQAAFFLVKFEQECVKTDSCTPGQLLTPAVEKDWTKFTIYEDIDLKNTIVDCLQCHQPGGPGTPKMLRMQERLNPWTHFFRDNTASNALYNEYAAAKSKTVGGTTVIEDYAGIPGGFIKGSDPRKLEDLVEANGFTNQPNEFQTRKIEGEVANGAPSATWQALYDASVQGQFIAVPFYDIKVGDPAKIASMTKAYNDVINGKAPLDQMPDIRNVFPDDKLAELGFRLKPGLDGAGIIRQACTQCHNSSLDQTISRAKFNANLSLMSREEKDVAIKRLNLPPEDPKAMPPKRFRDLSSEERKLAIDELMK